MPYFINTYRSPKPGQFSTVMKAVEEILKTTGHPGFVNIPLSPPNPGARGMGVISTIAGFETLD